MLFYSPLRYPGGKGKMSAFFHEAIKENDLSDGIYIEPYAGGASIAFSLLFNEFVSEVVINDIDRSIYAFWHSVLNNNKKLCDLILKTKLDIRSWKKCKGIQNLKKEANLLDLGFSTFYLNRTNHSGIINGGMIGGKEQTGKWKLDARFNRKDLIERIKRIGEYRERIKLFNLDANDLIKKTFSGLTTKALCYFDPPYYAKGKALYTNYYKPEDHMKMATSIQSIKNVQWIVSYDNVPEVKRMYEKCDSLEYDLNYSAARVRQGNEIMFFSKNLIVSGGMVSTLKAK
jgi:DNA adenine methylase